MQGWRTRAEVAKQLGMTERTLQRRLNEVGIRPARPGRTAMLSDADVTKLMEESRGRSLCKVRQSVDGRADHVAAQETEALTTELQQIIGLFDGTLLKPLPPSEALLIQQYAARKSLKPLPPFPELPPDPPESEEPPPG